MSLKPFNLPIWKMFVSIGAMFWLSSNSAMAAPGTPSDEPPDTPADSSTPPPVIVHPETRQTNPSTDGSSLPHSGSQARFSCEALNGQYTVVYHPQSQPTRSLGDSSGFRWWVEFRTTLQRY